MTQDEDPHHWYSIAKEFLDKQSEDKVSKIMALALELRNQYASWVQRGIWKSNNDPR